MLGVCFLAKIFLHGDEDWLELFLPYGHFKSCGPFFNIRSLSMSPKLPL